MIKARLSHEEKRIRREIREMRDGYRLSMELRVLDGSIESVVIERSKLEACNEILERLEEARP